MGEPMPKIEFGDGVELPDGRIVGVYSTITRNGVIWVETTQPDEVRADSVLRVIKPTGRVWRRE